MKPIQTSLLCVAALCVATLCACTSTTSSPYQFEDSIREALPRPPQEAQPPQDTAKPGDPKVTFVPVGIGFTSGPGTTMLGAAVDFPCAPDWTIGPSLELGVDDNRTLATLLFQAKRYFPITSGKDEVRRLLPYVHGGVGGAYLEEDTGPGSVDDTELVFAFGGGVRYQVSERVTLGSQLSFNFVPNELLDERSYTSWQVVQFVFTF